MVDQDQETDAMPTDVNGEALQPSSRDQQPGDAPGHFLRHVDTAQIIRAHPPHASSHPLPTSATFQVGSHGPGDGNVTPSDGQPHLRHVDSTVLLRAHRQDHPPRHKAYALQPVTFQVGGNRKASPDGDSVGAAPSSDDESPALNQANSFLHHVDSKEIIRSHPPVYHASPLGPLMFKAGVKGEDQITEADAKTATDVAPKAAEAEEENAGKAEADQKPMSKNQMKKILKKQKMEEMKAKRKAKEKEAKAAKKAETLAGKEALTASMTPEELEAYREGARAKKAERKSSKEDIKNRLKEAMSTGQRIVIDLDFEEKMKEGEMRSLCQQISYCYSACRGAQAPCHLHLTSYKGKVEECLTHQASGLENWCITKTPEPYIEKFKDCKSDLVYLTADSPNTLTELDKSKVYIIGGIVDRNRYKGLCFDKAEEQGIQTAALPISSYLHLTTSRVLTVNHVVSLMLNYTECKDWKEALLKIVPERKLTDADGKLAGASAASGPGAKRENDQSPESHDSKKLRTEES